MASRALVKLLLPPVSSTGWPGMNMRLVGLGVGCVWMNMPRRCCCWAADGQGRGAAGQERAGRANSHTQAAAATCSCTYARARLQWWIQGCCLPVRRSIALVRKHSPRWVPAGSRNARPCRLAAGAAATGAAAAWLARFASCKGTRQGGGTDSQRRFTRLLGSAGGQCSKVCSPPTASWRSPCGPPAPLPSSGVAAVPAAAFYRPAAPLRPRTRKCQESEPCGQKQEVDWRVDAVA